MDIKGIRPGWFGSKQAVSIACLLLFGLVGLWGGQLIGQGLIGPAWSVFSLARPSESGSRPDGQRNILLLGVDRLSAPEPELKSAWLIMHLPGVPEFTLVSVFPEIEQEMPFVAAAGARAFYLKSSGEPGGLLLDRLSKRIWWNNYLVIDEAGLEALLDHAGGIWIEEKQKNGSTVLSEFRTLGDADQSQLYQATVLQAFCAQASGGIQPGRAQALLEFMQPRIATDLDLVWELKTWLKEVGDLGPVRCEFPLGYAAGP